MVIETDVGDGFQKVVDGGCTGWTWSTDSLMLLIMAKTTNRREQKSCESKVTLEIS